MRNDRFYFDWAMILARKAFEEGYSPVGAVVVTERGEVYPASSQRKIGNVYHAEFRAMETYQHTGIVEPGSTLYSTLEPCIMCGGMAAVMKFSRIAWLVDDIWAGVDRVYNLDNAYIKRRLPRVERVEIATLHAEAQAMWVEYLVSTGHADAVQFMLGLPEGYKCR